jgi:hypothetical protein
VARNAQSHTAKFLAKALQANGQAKRNGNGASNGAETAGGNGKKSDAALARNSQ